VKGIRVKAPKPDFICFLKKLALSMYSPRISFP
jgi:hypothetical protein